MAFASKNEATPPARASRAHSLRFPRLAGQLLLAALQADEDAVRLVEELAQGLDVDVLVPAHHEDAGGAGRCIPAACKDGSRQGSTADPNRAGAQPGPGTHLRGRSASRTPAPQRGPTRSTAAWRPGRRRAPPARGGGGGVRENRAPPGPPFPVRPGPSRSSPLPSTRSLPLTTSGGSASTSSMVPTALASFPPAHGEAPPRLPEPLPAAGRGGSAAASPQRRRSERGTRRAPASPRPPPRLLRGVEAGAGGARSGYAEGSERPRRGGSGLRRGRAEVGVAGLREGKPGWGEFSLLAAPGASPELGEAGSALSRGAQGAWGGPAASLPPTSPPQGSSDTFYSFAVSDRGCRAGCGCAVIQALSSCSPHWCSCPVMTGCFFPWALQVAEAAGCWRGCSRERTCRSSQASSEKSR